MTNFKLFGYLTALLIGLALTTVNIVNAKEFCQMQYNDFAPLAQNSPEAMLKINAQTIEPSDVYHLTKKLAALLSENGIKLQKSTPILSIDSALPRTNLILAYDIFLLSQLYNQQQLGLVSIPPQLVYPDQVVPAHVYQWIDAAVALWQCHWHKPSDKQHNASSSKMQITPSDVYYLMTDIQAHLMEAIKPELLRNFLVLRLLEIEFLLQDIIGKQGLRLEQINQRTSSETTTEQLILDSVQLLSKVNGQVYLSKDRTGSLDTPLAHLQFRVISSALLAGELLFFNVQNQHIEPPPMLPILNRKMSEETLKSHLAGIQQMLTLFTMTIDNKYDSAN